MLVTAKGAGMLLELRVSELRYRAVLEVLAGAVISSVARRYGDCPINGGSDLGVVSGRSG